MQFYLGYIDPGTGSMLFTIVIGIAAAVLFFLKDVLIKIKFFLSGGKAVEKSAEKLPYVIFSDGRQYFNVFYPVMKEFERRGLPLTYYTMAEDDPALSLHFDHVKCSFIGSGNQAFAKINLLNARILLSTTPGLDVLQWKRSPKTDFYVHLFHDVTEGTGYRMFGMDYYDAVLLTGAFQEDYIRRIEKLRNLPEKEVFVTGSTYMDALAERKAAETENGEAPSDSEKTVLLAPSWGVSSILNKYGETFLNELKNTGYRIIVRPHPQMKKADPALLQSLQEKFPENERFKWNADIDNFRVLSEADIMITDYSGIMFDYSLVFDRSLIFADVHFDKAPYDAAWLPEDVWHIRILPKLGKKLSEEDFPRMKEVIDSVAGGDVYQEGRKKIRDTVWQYRGEAAVRTVDYLVKKYKELEEADTPSESAEN